MAGSTDLDAAVDAFFISGTVPVAGTSFDPDWPLLD
jgi:hypothetical protein